MNAKKIYVVGGGTVQHVRNHLAICAPAYGHTAIRVAELCREHSDKMDVVLKLTKMADRDSDIETYENLRDLVLDIRRDLRAKIVFFNPAVTDFSAVIGNEPSGKHAKRLLSYDATGNPLNYEMKLAPQNKLLTLFRNPPSGELARKDIFLVGFKTTCGATEEEQYRRGLGMLKMTSCNLVLANDTKTRMNMVITPEEASYHVTKDREEALRGLVEMAYLRSHLTFTRSIVVAGEPVSWDSPLVPEVLRTVVDYCIERGAYKPVNGATAGHFAIKIGEKTFLTSRRKMNFNHMGKVGLVKVETDGPDTVIAYGSKPSVGGQSQRIVFAEHPDCDCIVHFHCPIKVGSNVPTVSQREYECGSHECGQNTSRGLTKFGNLWAVYLNNHGPNIVFNKNIEPREVIDFIENNFELEKKTGGYSVS